MWPDELGKGFQDYVKLKIEHVVYDFMCTYVRRMKPDTRWKKILTNDSRISTAAEIRLVRSMDLLDLQVGMYLFWQEGSALWDECT